MEKAKATQTRLLTLCPIWDTLKTIQIVLRVIAMGNKTAFVRTRIDPILKEEVESMLHVWGITTTQAIDMFYSQIKRTRRFPLDLHFNAETERAIKDAKQGKRVKTYKDSKAMFKALGMLPNRRAPGKNIKKRISSKLKKEPGN